DLALHHDKKVMVEKAICGREFECAVLGDSFSGEVNVSGVGEIKPPDRDPWQDRDHPREPRGRIRNTRPIREEIYRQSERRFSHDS
ncbi:MAG: hypothetical protein II680_11055, partial [Clostridia bacterium]|nr:hypothetical protein [Clostridia bacterium]